jgi:hypothetical protein
MENENLKSQIIDQLNANSYQLNKGWYIRTYNKHYSSKKLSPELLEKQIKKDIIIRIILSLLVLIVMIYSVILLFNHVDNPNFQSNVKTTYISSGILFVILLSQFYTIICFNKLLNIYRFDLFLKQIYQNVDVEEVK